MDTQILTTHGLSKAAALLRAGSLVAIPTETVYGLAAPAFDCDTIQKIFQAKARPIDNPLIVHCADMTDVKTVADNPPALFYQLAEKFWPGPLTMIVKKHPHVPDLVSAGLPTVAIRIPNHPIALKLIKLVGQPLVAPSANRSGYPSPTTAQHVLNDLSGKIAAIIDGGPCTIGIESTIVDVLTTPAKILRPGIISQDSLIQATDIPFVYEDTSPAHQSPKSPGMKYQHYTPNAKIRIMQSWDAIKKTLSEEPRKKRKILASTKNPSIRDIPIRTLSEQSLYQEFRSADQEGIEEILVLCDETVQQHAGLWNRIYKAAEKSCIMQF